MEKLDLGAALLAFCRGVIIITFAIAVQAKLRGVPAFIRSISKFEVLPQSYSRVIALMVIAFEILIVLFALYSMPTLYVAFILSFLSLCLYIALITRVILSNRNIDCNCFGSSGKTLSKYDIYRNSIIAVCCIMGMLSIQSNYNLHSDLLYLLLLFPVYSIFAFIVLNTQFIHQVIKELF